MSAEFKESAPGSRKRKDPPASAPGDSVDAEPSAPDPGTQQHHDGSAMVDEEGAAEQEPVFTCKLSSTEVLTTLLSTLVIDKDQSVLCEALAAGLKFTVEKSKSLKAKAYVKASIFQQFDLREETVEFTVNLPILLQCLQVFGASSHMQLSYAGQGSPVCLILEDNGVITQCEIATLEGGSQSDFNFRSSPITSRAVIKSQFLKDSFSELDVPGGTSVVVHMAPRAPFLSMYVKGDNSSCKVDFPMDTEHDVFTEFECKQENKQSYAMNLIRPCMKALAKSDHTNLRMNEKGMLSMQHVIPTPDNSFTNWVEFLVCAST